MTRRCATRALKNARHLSRVASGLLPEHEPEDGYASVIPYSVLSQAHHLPEHVRKDVDAHIAAAVRAVKVPGPGTKALAPLFNGTATFVRITFTIQSTGAVVAVSSADMATAIHYASRAANPISRYAEQYGPNALHIAPHAIELAVTLPRPKYNDKALQGFVNTVVKQHGLPRSGAVIVLNPAGVVNTDGAVSKGFLGYHDAADLPYCFANVGTKNGRSDGFTLADAADIYALGLSHELAEMVVDPQVNSGNPEVCDACAGNCGPEFRDYFKTVPGGAPQYLGSTADKFPPGFAYDFFIAGIVKQASAAKCPAPASECDYAPPVAH